LRKEEEGVDENSKSDNAEVSEGEGSLFLVDHFIADEDFRIDDEYGDIDGETEYRDESRIVLGEFALHCIGTFSSQFRLIGHSDTEYTKYAEPSCRVVDDVGVERIVRYVARFDQSCDDCSIRTRELVLNVELILNVELHQAGTHSVQLHRRSTS